MAGDALWLCGGFYITSCTQPSTFICVSRRHSNSKNYDDSADA